MSPLDMLIFFFFILVTIKAVSVSIDYWKDADEEAALSAQTHKNPAKAHVSRSYGHRMPSSVRVTPIKRADAPAASCRPQRQYHLNDKGVA